MERVNRFLIDVYQTFEKRYGTANAFKAGNAEKLERVFVNPLEYACWLHEKTGKREMSRKV